MTLQQLKYIIQIVQCGSITMAAQKLYITQPSLSKAVSELEQEMGITIFLRSNRGVILSEEGTKFLSYARQVVEQAELLEKQKELQTAAEEKDRLKAEQEQAKAQLLEKRKREEDLSGVDAVLARVQQNETRAQEQIMAIRG